MGPPELLAQGSDAPPPRRRRVFGALLALLVAVGAGWTVLRDGGEGPPAPASPEQSDVPFDPGPAVDLGQPPGPGDARVLWWRDGTLARSGPGGRQAYRLPADTPPVVGENGRWVVGLARGQVWVAPAGDPRARPRRLGAAEGLLGVVDGQAYLVKQGAAGWRTRVVAVRLPGGEVDRRPVPVPPGTRAVGLAEVAGGVHVVVATRGGDRRTGVLDAAGRVSAWVEGQPLAVRGARLVTRDCGVRRCLLGLSSLDSLAAGRVVVRAPGGAEFLPTRATVVPNGALAVVANRRGRSPWSALVLVEWLHPRVPPTVRYVFGTANVLPAAGLAAGPGLVAMAVPSRARTVVVAVRAIDAVSGTYDLGVTLPRGSRLVAVLPAEPSCLLSRLAC
ncbi:MAG: hypothetical protein ACRDYU_17920 [Actinomycetes bacterium]